MVLLQLQKVCTKFSFNLGGLDYWNNWKIISTEKSLHLRRSAI